MKEKELKNEGLADLAYKAEADHEVQMARAELYKIGKYAIKLHEMLKGVSEQDGLEGWVQSKITKAGDYLSSVYHHMDYEQKFEQVQTEAKAKPIIGEENNTARLKRELDYDPDKVRSFINNLAKKQKTSALSDKEKQDFADAQELLADLSADLDEAKAKPDFLDMDKDGDKKEPMKKAVKDKEEKKDKKESTDYKSGLTEELNKVLSKKKTERSLTKPEEKKKEKYVKGMKKAKGDFKDRYGDDAEAVMYATATKMAKKESVLEDYVNKPITEEEFEKLAEKKDACYHKVKSRYKVWPSAYASGALVQCRKKGAKNWGNKSK